MALSQILGSFYKLPKSDPYAVYQLPYAAYLIQCCFITANIVWAGQCHNSLFLRKLTAQETINTAIKNQNKRKSVLFHFSVTISVTISAKFQLATYLLKIRFTTCQISHLFQIVLQGTGAFISKKRHWAQVLVPATVYQILATVYWYFDIGFLLKLNWPKRASAVYWILETFLHPCMRVR